MAYHWLRKRDRISLYNDYLNRKVSRLDLYNQVPETEIRTVINAEISGNTISKIFQQIDELLNGRKLDLIIGGPPCQAYSVVGRSRDKNRMQFDERNYLFAFYTEFLKRYKPRYFVFENVTGLLSARSPNGYRYFDLMRNTFKLAGYETEYQVLSSEKYGVLQNRKRVILVGKIGSETGFYPEPVKWQPGVSVKEVFKDMPPLRAGEGDYRSCHIKNYPSTYLEIAGIRTSEISMTWHWARPHTEQDLEIYRIVVRKWNEKQERLKYDDLPERLKTHKNRTSFRDRFKVVAADLPYSHTVVAHIARDGHYYIHPDIEQNRSLTPREAARLQTFPDDYFFESITREPVRTPAFRQIGNAVPVLLAQKIANKLLEIW
jgi:DNA (cytosine-5)-methyltransferase 1